MQTWKFNVWKKNKLPHFHGWKISEMATKQLSKKKLSSESPTRHSRLYRTPSSCVCWCSAMARSDGWSTADSNPQKKQHRILSFIHLFISENVFDVFVWTAWSSSYFGFTWRGHGIISTLNIGDGIQLPQGLSKLRPSASICRSRSSDVKHPGSGRHHRRKMLKDSQELSDFLLCSAHDMTSPRNKMLVER